MTVLLEYFDLALDTGSLVSLQICLCYCKCLLWWLLQLQTNFQVTTCNIADRKTHTTKTQRRHLKCGNLTSGQFPYSRCISTHIIFLWNNISLACRFECFTNFPPSKFCIIRQWLVHSLFYNMYAIPSSRISGTRCVLTFCQTASLIETSRLVFIFCITWQVKWSMHAFKCINFNHDLYITYYQSQW